MVSTELLSRPTISRFCRLTTRMTRFCLQIQGRRCSRVHRLAHASFPCCRSVLAYKHPGWHPVPFPKGRGRTLMALCIHPVVHAVRLLGRQSISAFRNSTHFQARTETVAVGKNVSLSPLPSDSRVNVVHDVCSLLQRAHPRENNHQVAIAMVLVKPARVLRERKHHC
jgi:hypothetical protein